MREQKKAEEAAKRAEELARKAEEDRRLAREQKMREREKLQKIQEEMEAMEKKRYLTAMGKNVENITADELKEVDTAKLAKEHAEKANKKKEEEERKIKEASKQVRTVARCSIIVSGVADVAYFIAARLPRQGRQNRGASQTEGNV